MNINTTISDLNLEDISLQSIVADPEAFLRSLGLDPEKNILDLIKQACENDLKFENFYSTGGRTDPSLPGSDNPASLVEVIVVLLAVGLGAKKAIKG